MDTFNFVPVGLLVVYLLNTYVQQILKYDNSIYLKEHVILKI